MANKDRASEAEHVDIVLDPKKVAHVEAENTLKQFDAAMFELDRWVADPNFSLRPSLILKLHRIALAGLSNYAGVFRPGGIKITGSKHIPVPGDEVPEKIEEFCDYINSKWSQASAMHLSAYALWKLNWIHPFADGNGRTSRIISYLILCAKLGYRLNGTKTIPDQIADNKSLYYKALEQADASLKLGKLDVSELEKMLDRMLAAQLLSVHGDANNANHARQAVTLKHGEIVSTDNEPNHGPIISHIVKYQAVYGLTVGVIGLLLAYFAI